MKGDFNHMIDAARYTPTIEKPPHKAIAWILLILFYIIGMINRAFLVPFSFIDSPSVQNMIELRKTDVEKYRNEVKNVIYRMVLVAIIVLLIWLL